MLPMLFLSHPNHASNGAKIADPEFGTPLMIAIDQSFHIVWIFGAALVAAA